MKKSTLFIIVVLLSIWSTVASAAVRVIKLHYVLAAKVVPLIEPLVSSNTSFSFSAYTLIVNASPGEMAKVMSLIRKLDVRPASLRISLRQTAASQRLSSGLLKVYRTQNRHDISQSIRLLEGRGAFIDTGQQVPLISLVRDQFWPTVMIEYKQVASGFFILPRVVGRQVILRVVSKHSELASNQTIDVHQLSTETIVPLGQWVSLGGGASVKAQDSQRTTYQSGRNVTRAPSVWIKIDKIN